jgi:hypothetical protein
MMKIYFDAHDLRKMGSYYGHGWMGGLNIRYCKKKYNPDKILIISIFSHKFEKDHHFFISVMEHSGPAGRMLGFHEVKIMEPLA